MIKIRDCILNEDKILSFDTLAEGEGPGVQVVMEGGHSLDLFDVTLPEVEAVLLAAGLLISPNELHEPVGPPLTSRELAELAKVSAGGYRWVSKDPDGHAYAYRNPPIHAPNQWLDCGDDRPAPLFEPYAALSFEDEAPLDIYTLEFTALEG